MIANRNMDSPYAPMHEIEPGLYLGDMDAARDEELLREYTITYVLGILDNFFCMPKFEGIMYHRIQMADSFQSNIEDHLSEALGFIEQARKEGHNVLVHCAAGISRSASFVIAYMMVKYNMQYDNARDFVRGKRDCIMPNLGFRRQLEDLKIQEYKKFLN
ncbi:hypothetical protein SteCoe_32103 [Stentor coeruleus]|uniref:Protein-serine/threonine phosphatase n=1 Tax=Stentor coeruleus TaxID=5963 RepID=A0A1R2AZS6_9CILI|nr:hypothetical protein SteCoe_32103 [Stentor coeruleus]